MSCQRRRRSVQLPRTPGCHRNTNSSAILSKYGKYASIGIGYCHIHIRIATPSSAFEFVFRWHASYMLLIEHIDTFESDQWEEFPEKALNNIWIPSHVCVESYYICVCSLMMPLHFPAVVPCLSEMTAVMSCWKVNSFDDVPCRKEIQDFVACAEKAVSHNIQLRNKLTPYQAGMPKLDPFWRPLPILSTHL